MKMKCRCGVYGELIVADEVDADAVEGLLLGREIGRRRGWGRAGAEREGVAGKRQGPTREEAGGRSILCARER